MTIASLEFKDHANPFQGDSAIRNIIATDAIGELFEIRLFLRSMDPNLPLDSFVREEARFQIALSAMSPGRSWVGIVREMALMETQPAGQSTYELVLVPFIWRLSERINFRVFQHKTAFEIVKLLCDEWNVPVAPPLLSETHPTLEMRVQYGESDLNFVQRLLEEEGLDFYFDPKGLLVVSDALQQGPKREGALRFVDLPQLSPSTAYVWTLSFSEALRSTAFAFRDHDYRVALEPPVEGTAALEAPASPSLEVFGKRFGSVLAEEKSTGLKVADAYGVARSRAARAERLAKLGLEQLRSGRGKVSFTTNAYDVLPGLGLSITEHPHPKVATPLLVTGVLIHGPASDEMAFRVTAVFADEPYRPKAVFEKPHAHGVQPAVVVGPPNEEIYTDELGRIQIRFLWEREKGFVDGCCAWVRVGQTSAGEGYGLRTTPRVGHEVLVAFVDGDPDQPVVVGSLHNMTAIVPEGLPGAQTKTVFRSQSYPGGAGFNELSFDDEAGQELVYLKAQSNYSQLVRGSSAEQIGNQKMIVVGGSRSMVIGASNQISVGAKHEVTVMGSSTPESLAIVAQGAPSVAPTDSRVALSMGYAVASTSSAFYAAEGGQAFLSAEGTLSIWAKGVVKIFGGPNVQIR